MAIKEKTCYGVSNEHEESQLGHRICILFSRDKMIVKSYNENYMECRIFFLVKLKFPELL